MHECVESSLPVFPTFTILHPKLWVKFILRLPKSMINEYSDKVNLQGDFRTQSIKFLMFPSPAGYMLSHLGFPLLHWGVFYKFFKIDQVIS